MSRAGRVWWWCWRGAAAVCAGLGLTWTVAYVGAVRDSQLDFGGYGDGSVNFLREHNTWWDVVSVATAQTGKQAFEKYCNVREWASEADYGKGINFEPTDWPCTVYTIGWPARCLWGADLHGIDGTRDGLAMPPDWVLNMRYVAYPLPTAPVWGGVTLNTLVFGVPVFAGLVLPGVLRRGWRRKNGRCLGCGYDRKGSIGVCPECGAGGGKGARTPAQDLPQPQDAPPG